MCLSRVFCLVLYCIYLSIWWCVLSCPVPLSFVRGRPCALFAGIGGSTRVFGKPLTEKVPHIFTQCLSHLQMNALEENGLFRIPGDAGKCEVGLFRIEKTIARQPYPNPTELTCPTLTLQS